jgi:hypothetical protein
MASRKKHTRSRQIEEVCYNPRHWGLAQDNDSWRNKYGLPSAQNSGFSLALGFFQGEEGFVNPLKLIDRDRLSCI